MSPLPAHELPGLRALETAAPPPPSPWLLASVATMRPVRARVPLWTLLLVSAATCVYPIVALALHPWRHNLAALPKAWLVTVALVWLAGFLTPLALAILPPRGQVLPDGTRAARAAVLTCLTLVLMGLFATVDAPGVTRLPGAWPGPLRIWWGCVSFGLRITVPAVLAGALVLRKVAVTRAATLGAAVGAAGGALAGLTLHGLCPVGGGLHVGLAHGGGVVIGALLGALWLPLLVRAAAGRRAR